MEGRGGMLQAVIICRVTTEISRMDIRIRLGPSTLAIIRMRTTIGEKMDLRVWVLVNSVRR